MSALVLAGIILSGAWTQLDEIGWIGWLPLAVILLLDTFPARWFRWPRLAMPREADRTAILSAAALCAIALTHLVLTFREEFGFGGDEGYHLSATRAFALYFMRAGPLLVAVLIVYALLVRKQVRYAASVTALLLGAASFALPDSALFGRYPTGIYLLAAPLNVLFEVVHSPYPYTANHVVNTLSLPAWLFVLRPLVIGRWPDWRVLAVALLVYLQPMALTLLGSPLLEPWAVVFALLSIEALAALEPERRWIAVALCVLAICFKETFVLLLPTTWLLACVQWRDGHPSLRPGALALGVAAITPFIVYYAVRNGTTARGYDAAAAASLFGIARLTEWLTTVRAQIGIGSMISITAAALLALRVAPLWIATAVGAAAFFLADAVSAPWTGYARFQIYSLVAVCAAIVALLYRRTFDRRALLAACAAITALQLPSTAHVLALDLQPDHERNSLEWDRGLIRLPIRQLADRIPALDTHRTVRRARVVTFGTDLTSLSVAYPDVAQRYELVPSPQGAAANDCRCRDDAEAVIAGFEWPANLGDTEAARASYAQVSTACVSEIETTCMNKSFVRDRSGAAVGALGVGRVLLLSIPKHDEGPKR